MNWGAIEDSISATTGERFRVEASNAVGGGCINEAVCLEGAGRRYFVKRNRPALSSMFEAEAAGLGAILKSGAIRAPRPIANGSDTCGSWLVLEYIEFGHPTAGSSVLLGEQLAAMHRCMAPDFGWSRDNTIGSTPQVNTWTGVWVEFLRKHRLGYQLALARNNGAPSALVDQGEKLLAALPHFFGSYQPSPSLLHGDLWGGNWGADTAGNPVIFDPAVYHGDREADLAMTELFGGFDDRFYQSYRGSWDIDPGYGTRKVLYNLYHILNHFNLFGGAYAQQAVDMINRLNSDVS